MNDNEFYLGRAGNSQNLVAMASVYVHSKPRDIQVESLPLRALARFGAKLRASSSRQPSSSERPKEVCQLRAANVAAAGAENAETSIHALSPFLIVAP